MKVLLLTGLRPRRVERFGTDDGPDPRLPQLYPYYGGLRKRGIEVTVASTHPEADRDEIEGPVMKDPFRQMILGGGQIRDHEAVLAWGMTGVKAALALEPRGEASRVWNVLYANHYPPSQGWTARLKESVVGFHARRAGRLIYLTGGQIDEGIRWFGADRERLVHLPNAIDTRYFSPGNADPAAIREEIRPLGEQPFGLAAGDQLRDEEAIARTMAEVDIPLLRLTQEEETVRFWEQQSHVDEVLCIFEASFEEMRWAYQESTFLLHLVDNSWQPAGFTVAEESLAMGTPVVMSEGYVTTELQRGHPAEASLMVLPERDPTLAREAVERILRDEDLRTQARKEGPDLVGTRFDVEDAAEKLAKALKTEVLKESPEADPT